MMRVVGRLADGWFPSLPRLPLDEVPGRMRLIDEAAERAGRDPRSIRRIANLGGEITDGSRPRSHRGARRAARAGVRRLPGRAATRSSAFAAEVAPALRSA